MTDRATIAEASRLTGVSERRLRRWVAAGHLPDVAGPRGRLVSVAAVRELAGMVPVGNVAPDARRTDPVEAGQAPVTRPAATGNGHDPTGGPPDDAGHWAALVERLHRENVELAGRVGFYQARIQELEGRLLLTAGTSVGIPTEVEQAPTTPPQPRRGWQFWRWGRPARETAG